MQLEVMTVRFRMTKVRKFTGVGLLLLFGELGPKNYDFPRYHVNDALKANFTRLSSSPSEALYVSYEVAEIPWSSVHHLESRSGPSGSRLGYFVCVAAQHSPPCGA